ncbi:protein of unknown function [Taphrina deformans PYCC 5710]|uniref:Kinetochore protein mis14 n=1 Tax=Taphrina deformans (strain PYCC 5710 / ATCC 11124 / CBS 356.35 / IMI 108563 / JCM 9778 / NBRC 8474) TaxID=1097556 RepID=R4XJX1_TAPDE|nr:protein of unknown function [Taphrina deformans PYCC 5710]|eukprot:CCG84748.1 protein of unknown function [Taphrina deformans PYCC 5710]
MSTLPKIPLDSSSDLAFLRLQLQQALSTRLSRHLPNALPEDAFRTMIEAHISAFLSKTMQEATGNVTINGMPPRPSDIAKGVQVEAERYETFSVALQADVLARHAVLEETITRVTRMRREVPNQILSLVKAREADSAVKEEEVREEEGVEEGEPEAVSIARLSEVQETYEKSVVMLREMKGSVGSVNAKAQRARDVLEFIQRQQKESATQS